MFCPRCSQEQVNEEIRFCSRCGLPLGLIAEVVAHEGFLPQLAALTEKKKFLTRRMGIKIGAAWLLIFLCSAPLFGLANEDDAAAAAAAIAFLGGFLIMIFSWMFLESAPKPGSVENLKQFAGIVPGAVGEKAQLNVLPPVQSQPAQSYIPPTQSWKAPNTGDFAKPPSVTEGTTKFFKEGQ